MPTTFSEQIQALATTNAALVTAVNTRKADFEAAVTLTVSNKLAVEALADAVAANAALATSKAIEAGSSATSAGASAIVAITKADLAIASATSAVENANISAQAVDQLNTPNIGTKLGELANFTASPGAGWLECNGTSYLRTAHPALAAILPESGIAISMYDNGYAGQSGRIATSQAILITDYANWGATAGKYAKRSTDNGATWQTIQPFPTTNRAYGDLYFAKNATGSVLLAMFNSWTSSNDYHFSKSVDHGVTWTEVGSVTGFGISTVASFCWDGINFLLFAYNEAKYIYSANDGTSWTTVDFSASLGVPVTSQKGGIYPTRQTDWAGHIGFVTGAEGSVYELQTGSATAYKYTNTPLNYVPDWGVAPIYDQMKISGRLGGSPVILSGSGVDWYTYNVPDEYNLGLSNSAVVDFGDKQLFLDKHWVSAPRHVTVRNSAGAYENIPLGVSGRAYWALTQADGSVVLSIGVGAAVKTMHLKYDSTYFKVPSFIKKPGYQTYIYAGA